MGYVVIGGSKAELIRRDNEHLHEELVIPSLQLTYDVAFNGADAEYRNAHQHYRHKRYRECIADCESAFESTMKTICDRRKWTYAPSDSAKALIQV